MKKAVQGSLLAILAASVAMGALLSPAVAGQGPDIGGLFGVILNNALAQQNRQRSQGQWQGLSRFERDCLVAHNTSPAILADHGVGLDDPKVQQAFAECAQNGTRPPAVVSTPVYSAPTGTYNPDFKVAGLSVGGRVAPDSAAYLAYKCHPSTDYPGFQWCGLQRPVKDVARPYLETMTIFHSSDYIAAMVLQDVAPAYFAPGDPQREIQRLSQRFGQSAHVITAEPRPDAPHSVIATWGEVTLIPLDADNLETLRNGHEIHVGIVMDFLGDAKASAREGLPVYRIGGGAGYIWSAKYDDSGTGRLRIAAVNASMIGSDSDQPVSPPYAYAPAPDPAPTPAAIPAPTPTATPDPDKVEADHAARVENAIKNARERLTDAEAFIQGHPKSPDVLLNYVKAMRALSDAVKTSNPEIIDRKITELSAAFSRDPDYQRYLAELAEAKKKQSAQFLGDALLHGEQQHAFLLNYIAKNPLSAAAPDLGDLAQQIAPLLKRGDLAPLQAMVDKIDLAIREADLEDDFVASQKDLPKTAAPVIANAPTPSPTPAAPQLPTTEKNKFLIEGDLADVEILYNASASAPHIALNLRGEYVFADNQASVCLFGENPDGFALSVKKTLSDAIPSKNVEIAITGSCDTTNLANYDIVATQRGAFLRSSKSAALALIKAIENDDYRRFTTITGTEVSKTAQSEREQIERIKANVSDGAPDGFGVVLLKTGSPNLCVAVADKADSHRELLLRASDKISFDMQSDVALKNTTIDDAFIGFQKRQCGAIYASAANLKTLTGALTRAGASYAFSSLWLSPAAIDAQNAAIEAKARADAQAETDRAQRNAEIAKLAAIRAKDFNATQAAQQAALRAKYGDSAKGASAALSSEVVAWNEKSQGSIGSVYPQYASWLADKLADHWEITTTDSELLDFGASNYKGRSLDTVFSTITLHLKNRILGRYDSICFVFGRINDTEFEMSREFIVAPCNDQAAISKWQAGHEFKSEWIAN